MSFKFVDSVGLSRNTIQRLENVRFSGKFSLSATHINNISVEQLRAEEEESVSYVVSLIMKKATKTTKTVHQEVYTPKTLWDYLKNKLPKWAQVIPFLKPNFLSHEVVTEVNHNYLCPHIASNFIQHAEFLKQAEE